MGETGKPSPASGMQDAVLACAAPTAGSDAAPAGGGGGDGGGGVVMVKRSTLAACLTCPLCGRLFRDAATITECLHTSRCGLKRGRRLCQLFRAPNLCLLR